MQSLQRGPPVGLPCRMQRSSPSYRCLPLQTLTHSLSASLQRCRQHSRQPHLRIAAAKDQQPSKDDRDSQGKADFSAYWSLKFREFFSKRRQYLDLARKRQEPPEIIQKLDAQIQQQEDKLEQERMARRRLRVEQMSKDPALQQQAIAQDQQLLGDIVRAREQLQQPQNKLLHLTVFQLRSVLRAVLLLPFTLPAAAAARWQALFASQSYEHFLLSEGERVWAFRNRTENERWFWEVFAMDRFFVPIAWAICYQMVVPDNLIWSVLVPFALISWQRGALPTPANLEWWLIMFFGLYWKCWDQVCGILAFFFKWW